MAVLFIVCTLKMPLDMLEMCHRAAANQQEGEMYNSLGLDYD